MGRIFAPSRRLVVPPRHQQRGLLTYQYGTPSGGGAGGTGFTTRPYLWQSDEDRLLASMTANDPEAFGTFTNAFDTPMAFISLCESASVAAGRGGYPITGGFNDIATWQLAIASYLKNRFSPGSGDAMAAVVANEVNALVAAHNGSPIISGDEYQHIEDIALNVAQGVDCCYDAFTSGERSTIATWLNDVMTYAGTQNRNFWPSAGLEADKEASNNNYHQNHTLALVAVGICSEGWNSSASTWRAKAEDWFAKAIVDFSGSIYQGAQVSEGRYYSLYIKNQLWAMQLYDAVMGTTFLADFAVQGPSYAKQLELMLYHLRPHHAQVFHDGSEANDAGAHLNSTGFGTFWRFMSQIPSSTDARVAKTIITASALGSSYSWARSAKGFENFYFNIRGISALAVSSKAGRRLAMPSPGGARTFLRSSGGWATSARAMVIFSGKVQWEQVGGSWFDSAGYSHANPDAPGFQFASGSDNIACDVEQDGPSGIAHEAGTSFAMEWGNYVGTATGAPPAGLWPIQVYNEDNLGAGVPHYYKAINAQPMWDQCTVYWREYIALDDLQVIVIYDRIATSGANNKIWRLHHYNTATITGGTLAEWTTGSTAVQLRDLYSTDGNPLVDAAVADANAGPNIRRLTQLFTSNSIRSLKVLSVNNRCSAAALSSDTGYLQADMTINAVSRAVRFFDDGSHATVS